ncbi:hypothetical protein ACIBCO_39270 [Streptomyces violascens]|uniref:hypothetical protein n=1 Tax=Streptomyces violascens TaxID=67381 RepID=UPI0037B867AD
MGTAPADVCGTDSTMPSSPDRARLVGTAEIGEEFGVSTGTVTLWYNNRSTTGFPETAGSKRRARQWEHGAVSDWFAAKERPRLQQAGAAALAGDPDELLNATQVAKLLGYKNANQITNYLRDRPGYFPEPDVVDELGTTDRPWTRKQWRRSTVTSWAATRRGKGNRHDLARQETLSEVSPNGDPDELLAAPGAAALLGYKNVTSFSSALSQGILPRLKEKDGTLPGARGQRPAWTRRRILEQAQERASRRGRSSPHTG